MSDFKNQKIWITGASSGIGAALAFEFNKLGARVLISARRPEALQTVKNACKYPENVEVLVIDLEQIQMASEIVDRAFQLMGDIDVLVANAGIGQSANALDTKEEVEMRIFNINYHGHLAISKWVIKRMLEKGRGQVVAIGSIAGKFGQKKLAAYSASKAALIVYYESLAQELSNTPIKIQVVSPGFIQTNVTLNSLDANGNRLNKNSKAQENGMPTSVFAQKFIKAIKKKRFHQYVGGKELLAVPLHAVFPALFYKLLSK